MNLVRRMLCLLVSVVLTFSVPTEAFGGSAQRSFTLSKKTKRFMLAGSGTVAILWFYRSLRSPVPQRPVVLVDVPDVVPQPSALVQEQQKAEILADAPPHTPSHIVSQNTHEMPLPDAEITLSSQMIVVAVQPPVLKVSPELSDNAKKKLARWVVRAQERINEKRLKVREYFPKNIHNYVNKSKCESLQKELSAREIEDFFAWGWDFENLIHYILFGRQQPCGLLLMGSVDKFVCARWVLCRDYDMTWRSMEACMQFFSSDENWQDPRISQCYRARMTHLEGYVINHEKAVYDIVAGWRSGIASGGAKIYHAIGAVNAILGYLDDPKRSFLLKNFLKKKQVFEIV